MPASYSFSPQFATIRSASPLSEMRPIVSIPEVRHTALTFREIAPIKVNSAQPELITGGIASAISEGAGGALKGITAAYVGERDKKEALEKETREHERAKELANIRSKDTPEKEAYDKAYRELQLKNLESQIKDRGGDIKPSLQIIPSRQSRKPLEEVNVPLPQNSDPDFSLPEGAIEGASLQGIQAPSVVTNIPSRDTLFPLEKDFFKEPKPPVVVTTPLPQGISRQEIPSFGLTYVPVSEDYPTDLSKLPVTPQQMADFATQQSQNRLTALEQANAAADQNDYLLRDQQQGISQLINNYESFEDALIANKEIGRIMPDYEPQEVLQKTTPEGQNYYVVQPPRQKATGKQGVPPGMQVKSGKLDEAGVATYDLEPEIPKEKKVLMLSKPLEANETMLRAIKQIKGRYKGLSPATGLMGSVMQYVQGSDAADVRKLVKALTGNIAFRALGEMRAASPTGSALGAVSDTELNLLAASMGSIDPGLSPDLFTENINRIEEILTKYNQNATKQIEELEKPQNFQSIQSQENRVEIKSQEDYNKLKPTQKYIWNGVTGTKK